MTATVEVVEVALRDGLQNEAARVTPQDKVRIAGLLADAGARRIEAVSFVHPKAVPAMADAEVVMASIERRPGVAYSGLVLNERGLDRAIAAGVDEINVVVCASDTFSRRNQNMTMKQSLTEASAVIGRARAAGLPATLTVATAFGCPFEGTVDEDVVLDLVVAARESGADEVCLADTIGVGVPAQVTRVGTRARDLLPDRRLRFHFHDTRNTAIANAWAALESGADALDSSAGGLGGCPFAPAATGNVATEDLVYLLDRSGIRSGLDLDSVVDAGRELVTLVGRTASTALSRAGGFPAPSPASDR
ncbi:hydroxymethylglutaryl-CoA lyase [Gordonia sp. NPDC058843]|uniref:hydroxymethylglutaryl-CoA lyase n=1 Tax=Gordonia sp. NPDC058843 TaxID=3346648 RepID=UPI0036CBAEF9